MLYFVSAKLSLSYLLFAFVSALGVLQWVAARHRLDGVALLDYSRHASQGYALGALLVLLGAVTFFLGQWPLIFRPGPAGAELTLLFAVSALCALSVTFVMASLVQPRRASTRQAKGAPLGPDDGQVVTVGPAAARLYTPSHAAAPMPAVCLLPGLLLPSSYAGTRSLQGLRRELLAQGFIVLVIEPSAEAYAYPGVLAIVPAGRALLSKLSSVDPQRVGAAGHDLGGDLVIRSASADAQIKAVVALAPLLGEPPKGLDLLREMPYLQALRWTHARGRAALRGQLTAVEYGVKIQPRALLVVYGTEDRLVTRVSLDGWGAQRAVVQGAAHLDLPEEPAALRTAVQWFKEHL